MPSETIELVACSQDTSQFRETKPLHNLLMVGLWPFMFSFARRCHEAGIAVHTIRIANEQLARPRQAPWLTSQGGTILRSEIGTDAALQRVVSFAHAVKADAICTVEESTLQWLVKNRSLLEPGCRLMAPSTPTFNRLLDKAEQIQLAQQSGFPLLDSWWLHSHADADAIPQTAFPICLRPTGFKSVQPNFKAERLDSPEDLRAFLASRTWTSAPLVAQPYCHGPNIVLHAVRSASGEMQAVEAFRAYKKCNCLALSLERCDLPDAIIHSAKRFAELASLHGPFHFDLIQSAHTGEIFFLEVNGRMGGTSAKIQGLGYDEPMLAFSAFGLAPPRQPRPLKRGRRATSKRTLVAQILASLKRPPGPLDFPQASRSRSAWSNFVEALTVPDPLLSWRDPRGTWLYLFRGMDV